MVTKLPIGTRLAVLLIILSEHSLSFLIPTYIAYMMEGFLISSTSKEDLKSQISYHAGTMEGLNRLMMFFSGFFWGAASDKIGRKRCLVIVLFGLFISSIGFGLASSFTIALIWRMITGLLAGTIPITKAMIRDLSDDSNIAILFSYFTSGSGLAAVIGPLIGGYFSHPADKFSLLNSTFFQDFPYFLPQFIQ